MTKPWFPPPIQSSYGINGSNYNLPIPCQFIQGPSGSNQSGRKMSAIKAASNTAFMYDGSTINAMNSDALLAVRISGRHRPPGSFENRGGSFRMQ